MNTDIWKRQSNEACSNHVAHRYDDALLHIFANRCQSKLACEPRQGWQGSLVKIIYLISPHQFTS